jgi:hypothetical protein
VRISLSEALDIFRKWESERALVRCTFSFRDFAASLSGRVARVSERRIDFWSDDKGSELALRVRPALEFAYGEPRRFPAEAEIFKGAVGVFFPSAVDGDPESLWFLEVIEDGG